MKSFSSLPGRDLGAARTPPVHRTSSKQQLRDGADASLNMSTFVNCLQPTMSALLVLLLLELSPQQPQPCSPSHQDGPGAPSLPCSSFPSQLLTSQGCLVATPSSTEPIALS